MVLRDQGTLGDDPEALSLRRTKYLPGQEAVRTLLGWKRGREGGWPFQVRTESGKRREGMIFEPETLRTPAVEREFMQVWAKDKATLGLLFLDQETVECASLNLWLVATSTEVPFLGPGVVRRWKIVGALEAAKLVFNKM